MTVALEGREWSAVRPGRSLPPGKTRYTFYRGLGGPQGRSGGAENLIHTGIFFIWYLRPYIMFNQCSYIYNRGLVSSDFLTGSLAIHCGGSWRECSYYATWTISSLTPILQCVILLLQSLVSMAYLEL